MSRPFDHLIDPELDLTLERVVPLPRGEIWRAWTTPELLVQWFCPRPWTVVEADIDLRPGGRFFTVMQSPEGERFPGDGCYVEVIDGARLAWTNAMGPGFRPAAPPDETPSTTNFAFTAVLTLTDVPGGTRYHALAKHRSRAEREVHETMGFHVGWGMALDQLIELLQLP